MYSRMQLGLKYLKYYFRASNGKGHGMHSPFVFDFITKVLNDKTSYPSYQKIETLRQKLLQDKRMLHIEDMGAGSSTGSAAQRSVAEIAKHAAKPKKYGQLLYRMVKHYQPKTILDLGTSLGITTAYLAEGNAKAKLVTAEGAKEIAEVAKENFKVLGLQNVEMVRGDFKYTLPMGLKKLGEIDFAFIDGNHRLQPTLDYFNQAERQVVNHSILVFDDIHWSAEMEEAWKQIQLKPQVTCTIDLFFLGIVFFRKEFKEKQHFTIWF